MNTPVVSPSPALLTANERLLELRQRTQQNKAEPGLSGPTRPLPDQPPWVATDSDDLSVTAVTAITRLPSHLGWESQPVSLVVRKAWQRCEVSATISEQLRADHPSSCPMPDRSHTGGQPSGVSEEAGSPFRLPLDGDTVRHYPSIGLASLQVEQVAPYRVWLLCRYLDEQGRGWLPLSDVCQQLTGKGSKLRLFGWRRLRQVLGQGQGLFWEWDKTSGRLWLYGAAAVAANLDVHRLTGRVVALPLSAMTAGIGDFKAHLYAAWHSGRRRNNPISREVQATLTGVPERTQRHYCQATKIKQQSNIVIGSQYTTEEAEQQAWQRGRAIFSFTDFQGRQGRKGRRYIAWRLPNSYSGPHQQTANGRIRKINRKLKDLVRKGARGNNGTKVKKRYFANGAEAARALNRGAEPEKYWPTKMAACQSGIWAVFSLR